MKSIEISDYAYERLIKERDRIWRKNKDLIAPEMMEVISELLRELDVRRKPEEEERRQKALEHYKKIGVVPPSDIDFL